MLEKYSCNAYPLLYALSFLYAYSLVRSLSCGAYLRRRVPSTGCVPSTRHVSFPGKSVKVHCISSLWRVPSAARFLSCVAHSLAGWRAVHRHTCRKQNSKKFLSFSKKTFLSFSVSVFVFVSVSVSVSVWQVTLAVLVRMLMLRQKMKFFVSTRCTLFSTFRRTFCTHYVHFVCDRIA